MAPLAEIGQVFDTNAKSVFLLVDLQVFDYPSDKPRTPKTVAQMRTAEQALDEFWAKVNAHCVEKTGQQLQALASNVFSCRHVQRTPPWIAVGKEENTGDSSQKFDIQQALATLIERTERTIEESSPLTLQEKTKTRGSQSGDSKVQSIEPNVDIATASIARPDATDIAPLKIRVKKKSFNTFAALFHKPFADKLPGELPWSDFKRAMVNAGFGAEKLQGSAWLFESKSGSIIFHEPHPESKLPVQLARRIARRLNRNFGWTMDTFLLSG